MTRKQAVVFYSSIVSAFLTFIAVAGFVGMEAYVRWNLNQNFSFLGGFGLPSLVFLFLGLMLGLMYYTRVDIDLADIIDEE